MLIVSTFVSVIQKQKKLTKNNKIKEIKEQITNCSKFTDVGTLMQYTVHVTLVPRCLSTSDGYILLTDKTEAMKNMLHELTNNLIIN